MKARPLLALAACSLALLSGCALTVPVKVATTGAKVGVKTAKAGVKTAAKAGAALVPDRDPEEEESQ